MAVVVVLVVAQQGCRGGVHELAAKFVRCRSR